MSRTQPTQIELDAAVNIEAPTDETPRYSDYATLTYLVGEGWFVVWGSEVHPYGVQLCRRPGRLGKGLRPLQPQLTNGARPQPEVARLNPRSRASYDNRKGTHIMPIKVTLNTATGKARVKSFILAIDTIKAVDSIAADYLDTDGMVDLENFGFMKIREIQATLTELDAIIKRASGAVMFPVDLDARTQLRDDSLNRARQLAAAIRQAATL